MKKQKRKKSKEVWFKMTIPTYDVDVLVRVNMSAERANTLTFKRYKTTTADDFCEFHDSGNTKGQFTKLKCGGYAIWIKDKKSFNSIVHETTHLIHYMFRERRIPLSEDTEEVYAYTLSSTLENILDGIKKY